MKDMMGIEIKVGQLVLKPTLWGRSPVIEQRIVTAIIGDKIYLDDSKVAIKIPDRLVVYDEVSND